MQRLRPTILSLGSFARVTGSASKRVRQGAVSATLNPRHSTIHLYACEVARSAMQRQIYSNRVIPNSNFRRLSSTSGAENRYSGRHDEHSREIPRVAWGRWILAVGAAAGLIKAIVACYPLYYGDVPEHTSSSDVHPPAVARRSLLAAQRALLGVAPNAPLAAGTAGERATKENAFSPPSVLLAIARMIGRAADAVGDDPDLTARASVVAPSRQEEEEDAMWMLEESSPPLFWSLLEASDRVLRDVAAAAAIIWDYYSLTDRSEEGWSGAHQRAAERLLRLCQCNMGVYIKLGQHVAQLDYLLPEEYTRTLAPMTRRAPVSPIEDVRETIRKDLGAYPEDLFRSFEQRPIASASLAQVHRAVMLDGRQVAVKVQHAGLRERSVVDVMTIDLLVGIVRRVFPRFEYSWLVDEVKRNLPRELDFRLEALNIESFRRRFEASAQVAAPVVVPEYTARRVLTMSFEPGVYVDDLQALQQQNFDIKAVADSVFRVFNEQIFVHGEVHCDPHGGNVLVRPFRGKGAYQRAFKEQGLGNGGQIDASQLPPIVRTSSGQVVPELVVLDHGLYRRYDDEFRLTYAELWRALIFSDADGIKEHAQKLQAGSLYPLFAAMLTTKSWDEVLDPSLDSLTVDSSAEGKQKTATNAREYMDGINHLLRTVPRDLLLLLKTNDNLRALDASLGHPSNPYLVTAEVCVRGAHDARRRRNKTWGTWWAASSDEWAVWAGVQGHQWSTWWARLGTAAVGNRGDTSTPNGRGNASGSGSGGTVDPEAAAASARAEEEYKEWERQQRQ